MKEDESGLLERIEQKQKEYYRLSIRVAVIAAILVAAVLQELNSAHHEALLFLALILTGNLPQVFSSSAVLKFAEGRFLSLEQLAASP